MLASIFRFSAVYVECIRSHLRCQGVTFQVFRGGRFLCRKNKAQTFLLSTYYVPRPVLVNTTRFATPGTKFLTPCTSHLLGHGHSRTVRMLMAKIYYSLRIRSTISRGQGHMGPRREPGSSSHGPSPRGFTQLCATRCDDP